MPNSSASPREMGLTAEDLDEAFAIAQTGVWRWEVGGNAFLWSAEVFRIAGRDPQTFKPTLKTTLSCIHPDDRDLIQRRLREASDGYDPSGREFRVLRPDGTERYCWARISSVRLNDRVVAIRGVLIDLTDRRQAELALLASEDQYRNTVELSPQMPWTADPAGYVLTVSGRWSTLTGVLESAALGTGWLQQFHPEDRKTVTSSAAVSLGTGQPIDVKARLICADGGLRWMRIRAFPKLGQDGKVVRWYGVAEDIDDQVNIELALRASEAWIREAHEAAGVGLFEVDFAENVTRLSAQSLVLLGLAADADPIFPGESWTERVHPDDAPQIWAAIRHATDTGEAFDFTFRVPLDDAAMRWVNGMGRIEYDTNSRPRRLIGVNFDVSARREAQAALHESEALNRSIVNASPDNIKLLSPSGEILFANQACRGAMELEQDAKLVGRNWLTLWPTANRSYASDAIAVALAGGTGRFTSSRPTALGRPKWWDVAVSPVLDEDGAPRCMVSIARDITDQKTAQDRINWSASHDPLTQLPNRRLFDARLAEAIIEAETGGQGLALLVLDVDQFKQINDTQGHGAGDAVLRTLGERLCAVLRPVDTVARLGGDEFALILPGIDTEAEAGVLADRILASLREPIPYEGTALDCRASLGASFYPRHGANAGDLLKHADIALYSSKARRPGQLLIFDSHMRVELQQRVSMTNLARSALRDDRIRAFYQPKVDLLTGRVAGFEALARWTDYHGRIHHPATISAAFDDWDVSTAITDRMLAEVIGQMRDWTDRGMDFGHVALNASAADFQRSDFGEFLLTQLSAAGIPTKCFQLEVTETVFLRRGADLVERTLRLLSREGVKIALDDFGTGYASLSHLNQFPVDVIKIDRSFVSDIGLDQDHAAIAEAVITLGRKFGMEVVAEGIETPTQARRLVDLGCQYGQGFLFLPATSPKELGDIASLRFEWDGIGAGQT
ncbi:MAG: EAL domain-containing protein [Sphingomonas sp.]